jgi:predicted alpha-1,6-mannanase (GH76 family)
MKTLKGKSKNALVILLAVSLFVSTFLPGSVTVKAYTSTTADVAMDAFQNYCYNPNTKLYYGNTDQNGVAAIWTHAIFWNMVMDAYERTGDSKYLTLINDIYEGGYAQYDGYNWNNKEVWFVFDDLMWWIISMARAYEITGNAEYLDVASDGFDNVYSRAYDPVNGGVFWGFGPNGMGKGHKNSCINYPTIIAALRFYEITGNVDYLNKATDIYSWARTHLFNASTGSIPDLISDQGVVDWTNYTYNQGTMIGAASMLFLATGNISYLNDANLAANYTREVMCNNDGILPAEGDWNEQGTMKAIFAHYISVLIKDCGQTQWLPWIYDNINLAWSNRDNLRNLMYRDYTVPCSSGMIQTYEASSAVAFLQIIPPDQSENKQSIPTPQITVYENDQYGGTPYILRPGRYTKEALTKAGVPDNWVTSLKVPDGCTVEIYSEDNFTGTMWEFTSDSPNIGPAANDQMTSCIIYYDRGVTFYSGDLFQGSAVTLTKGTYSLDELIHLGIPNDSVSSLAIPKNCSVIIYENMLFNGQSWLFNYGTHNVGAACNDKMSSVRIY